MRTIIKGRNMNITEALKKYIRGKLSKVEKIMDDKITKAEVELFFEKNPSIKRNNVAEITLFIKGAILRAKSTSGDMYASIDLVINKVEKQVRKYKGKHYASHKKHANGFIEAMLFQQKKSKKRPKIIKKKQFIVKPMNVDEAAMQMEMIGHDFFVFANYKTEAINIIYKRKDNNYGLIEAIIEE